MRYLCISKQKIMITRTFGSFTFEEVEDMFLINRIFECDLLEEWLTTIPNIDDIQRFILNKAQNHLFRQVFNWNEDELKMFFIGPLIELADLETPYFKPFTQRTLSLMLEKADMEIAGKVDFMLATGKRTAKPPYFCIHEYKQEANGSDDAPGQLLIAMVVAQTKNENKFPILGAYIVSRNWFFVVLDDKNYAVSNAYNAADDDIFQIFAILQKSKEIIQRHLL